MEQALDRILAGQNGVVTYEKTEMVMLYLGQKRSLYKPKDGKDVYTTLSADLQTYLETRMNAFQEKSQRQVCQCGLGQC